jgi:hypothetical protein
MKLINFNIKIIVIFSALLLFYCQKDDIKNGLPDQVTNIPIDSSQFFYSCNDLATIKSQVDLKVLNYIDACYLCYSTKSVPGLGSINWISNTLGYNFDSIIKLEFKTYYKNFNQYYSRERIGFITPQKLGKYKIYDTYRNAQNELVPYASYIRTISDGDVVDGVWLVDTLCQNFLNITQFNKEDKYISGDFELHLVKKKGDAGSGIIYSDRINFLNGKFQANIN